MSQNHETQNQAESILCFLTKIIKISYEGTFGQYLGSQVFRCFKLVDVQIRVWRSQPAVVPSTQPTHD